MTDEEKPGRAETDLAGPGHSEQGSLADNSQPGSAASRDPGLCLTTPGIPVFRISFFYIFF